MFHVSQVRLSGTLYCSPALIQPMLKQYEKSLPLEQETRDMEVIWLVIK